VGVGPSGSVGVTRIVAVLVPGTALDGWTTITKRVRVKKVKTVIDLEEESKLDNWDDVEHYGRATYVNTERPYEHNGALFDIGSRF
jgi:hypothetical protein